MQKPNTSDEKYRNNYEQYHNDEIAYCKQKYAETFIDDYPTELRLFVWESVLWDYTEGIAFAYATSLGEARRLVLEATNKHYSFDNPDEYVWWDYIDNEPKIYTTPVGYAISGGG